ncbi:MAG: rod-determining factor RdfA [Haloplanus sp.]
MAESPEDGNAEGTGSKVGRLLRKYDLDGVGGELERRWTADGEERMSLRALADWMNQRLLREALDNAGVNSTERDVAHIYETLRGEGSTGERIRKERELERQGVSVEELQSDFVSHQAIHTYLKKYREAEYERGSENPKERSVSKLQRLRSRTIAVTDETIQGLSSKEELSVGDFDVVSEIRVRCTDCGTEYDAVEFIERGGCECR